ncbi:MAG: 2OG-Fe(II) oxygenase [Caulobacter sp.]|nr:2OG-Fe(II) oxygenase [Caulobacter sp.]
MALNIGDPAPWFFAPTQENPRFAFATLAGRWVGLMFAPDAGIARSLAERVALSPPLADEHGCLFGVAVGATPDSVPGPRWFIDPDGGLAGLYGMEAGGWLLLDPQLRLFARGGAGEMALLQPLMSKLPRPSGHAGVELSAPVLILPRLFEPGLCKALIETYRQEGGAESGFMREIDGITRLISDPRHKRRKDVILEDESLKAAVRERINRRLIPEISKAFQFQSTRIERYLVACYPAGAGWFRPHRDNTTKGTAHRKFAVTINLNAEDYEGGELRFPEFGDRRYRPPTGGAVVFSCSMLHEALPVTRGERYAFLPFLYDEASARLRDENLKFVDLPEPVSP